MNFRETLGQRLAVTDQLDWPSRFKRVPFQARRGVGCPSMEDALSELLTWLDLLNVGYAELGVGRGGDSGAVIRFEWRGKRLVAAADGFVTLPANVHSLRAPLNALTILSSDGQQQILNSLLTKMADADGRPLPNVKALPADILDLAELELSTMSDSLVEASVRITRGEFSGAIQLDMPSALITWSTRKGSIKAVISSKPSRPQSLALAKASLELEPWLTSVSVLQTLEVSRWTLLIDLKELKGVSSRDWMSTHTVLRERKPELVRWLREGLL
jgi:hypothetical protein